MQISLQFIASASFSAASTPVELASALFCVAIPLACTHIHLWRYIAQKGDQILAPSPCKPPAHRDFAQRMAQACDGNPSVPLPNFGRLRWFAEQLENRFDFKTTPETIRKWFAGETLPRLKTMKMLAAILGVDEAWLALGRAPELDSRRQTIPPAILGRLQNAYPTILILARLAWFLEFCYFHFFRLIQIWRA